MGKKWMLGFLALSLVTFGAMPAAFADDAPAPELRAEAARFLDATQMLGLGRSFRAVSMAASQGYRFPADVTPEAAAKITALEAALQEKSATPFRETMIDIFASRLTLQQLQAVADFYDTPAGKARIAYLQKAFIEPSMQGSGIFDFDAEMMAVLKPAAEGKGLTLPDLE